MSTLSYPAPDGIPNSHLPFSPYVQVGDFVFVSGQASVTQSGEIVAGSFAEEMRRSMENLKAVLGAAGCDFKQIVQTRNYLANQSDLVEFNRIYREYFSSPYPARTTIVGVLGTLLKYEIDAVATAKS